MHGTLIITQREWLSYFRTPVGYIVAVVFLAFNGYVFGFYGLVPGEEVSMRALFGRPLPVLLMFVIPMMTMRLMSEEFRSGTIEGLMTTPVSDAAVIGGKFLGALAFFLCLVLTTLPYVVALACYGSLDWGSLCASYIGVGLMGALYISVGLFFSTCTSNQIVAVISSFSVLAVLAVLTASFTQHVAGTTRVVLQHISIGHHYIEFIHGTLNLNGVVFFVTTTTLMLFMAVKVLESRRWR